MAIFPTTQVNKARLLMVCLAGFLVINLVALGTASWTSMSRSSIVQGSIKASQPLPIPPVAAPIAEVKGTAAPKAVPAASVESHWPAQENIVGTEPSPTTPLPAPQADPGSKPSADELREALLSLEPLLAQVREVFSGFPFAVASKEPESQLSAGQEIPSPPEKSKSPVLRLVNPSETGGDVHYAVDGKSFSLRPGEYHELTRETALQIDFHRGDDFGYAKLVVHEGIYVFAVGATGWDLAPGKEDGISVLRRAN